MAPVSVRQQHSAPAFLVANSGRERIWLGGLLSGLLHAAIAVGLLGLATGLLAPPRPVTAAIPVDLALPEPAPVETARDDAPARPTEQTTKSEPASTPASAKATAARPAAVKPPAPTPAPAPAATPVLAMQRSAPVPYLDKAMRAGDAMTAHAVRQADPRLEREDALLRQETALMTPATERSALRYRAAAAQGYAFARYNLARVMAAGRGTPRDIDAAAAEFRAAAEQGYLPAMLRLAELHLAGEGVGRDKVAAASWYYLAAALDSEAGRRGRALVATRLDARQRDAARDRAVALRAAMPPLDPATRQRHEKDFINAAASGDIELVRRLLAEGVDANTVDQLGRTGLINAAWRGHTDIVELLAGAGVDIDATDDNGRTGLMWSAINGHYATLRRLLAYDAYVDPVDGEGLTPLMRAAWNGHTGVVRALLAHDADPLRRDHAGKTALDRARSQDEQEIIQLLLQADSG